MTMHFVVNYTLTGERTKERSAELMSLFGERGSNASTIAHWVYADGGGGFLITDGTEMELLYQDALAYSTWMEFSATPIISIEEAVPQIAAWMGG
jgi:hypothetical protein